MASTVKDTKSKPQYDPAPLTKHFEFMGPPGALGITIATTFFAYFFALGCSEHGCPSMPFGTFLANGFKKYTTADGLLSLWDPQAALLYTAWYTYTMLCWWLLPGEWVSGVTLRNGEALKYKMNGYATLLLAVAIMLAVGVTQGVQPFVYIFDHWVGLVTASLLNAFLQGFLVFAKSYRKGAMLAEGGNSNSHLYNWFIGRELNPRIGAFDIKSFNELRPGIILWLVVLVSCACKQYDTFGYVSASMWLVVGFESLYIVDSVYNESAVLTTMDITTDGFGFMLSTGDLVWVPWTYSLQARYLAFFPNTLGLVGVLAVLTVHMVGYYIFRVSNLEKNDFRKGNNPKNLSFMQTKRGTKLLTSGWWGVSRHPNYMGDWIMGWSWCLPTGFHTPLTYYYVIYFAILLAHRQQRDDEACRRKYGDDWIEYCKRVRSKILPGIY